MDYLRLCRISNLPTVWTNVLCALVLSGTGFSWPALLLLAASMSLFYSAGMCLNDICDAETDRIKKPFRPIPSGKISLRSAWFFTAALFAAALSLLLPAPHPEAVWAGFALLACIVLYDVLHKAHAASVLLMAACRLLVYLVTAIAVAGAVSLDAAAAGFVQFANIVLISIMARHEKSGKAGASLPPIPLLIAGISMLDGIVMALFASPAWIAAGAGGAVLTYLGQRYVRGD